MFLIIEFSFMVFRCQIKAQTISVHCVFQKGSRSKKSLKIDNMFPKLKKSLKIGESCLELVKFTVFTQKIQKKSSSSNLRNFTWNWPWVKHIQNFTPHLLKNRICQNCVPCVIDWWFLHFLYDFSCILWKYIYIYITIFDLFLGQAYFGSNPWFCLRKMRPDMSPQNLERNVSYPI